MATWSAAYINDLPDSGFACTNSSGRHYPHHDASGTLDLPHLRAALSRIGDPNNEQCGKGHLMAHAKAEGMGKALLPVKAQPMDDEEMTAWFEGRVPRRILALPFGGPFYSPTFAKGVDLDGQTFTERTDIYGPYQSLRETRERLVDWHHGAQPPSQRHGDPTGMMSGQILGKSILDPSPDTDGWWADFWFKAGEKRVGLIRQIVDRQRQIYGKATDDVLYGSSQPAPRGVKIDPSGEILVWPHWMQTLTTSPQNTFSVLRPSKAMLDDIEPVDPALRRVLDDLEALGDDLSPTLRGEAMAKAGRYLDESLEPWERLRRR